MRARNFLDQQGYSWNPSIHDVMATYALVLVVIFAGFWAMPSARATHEPSHVSLSRPSVSVAIAGEAR